VLIETASVGLTGYEADAWLRDERQVDVELVDHRRVMPLVTFAHGEEEVDRLVGALRDLVDEKGEPGADTPVRPLPSRAELRTEQAMLPRDAFFAATESVKPRQAAGRVRRAAHRRDRRRLRRSRRRPRPLRGSRRPIAGHLPRGGERLAAIVG
jgi:arginine/lysine/ornithine decarboxylase